MKRRRAFLMVCTSGALQPFGIVVRPVKKPALRTAGCSLILLLSCVACFAQRREAQPAQTPDLTSIKIEDLMNIKVSSVSRTEENLSRTASAVFVIGQEDIRRSGALNIPDLLRMVPGVDVAQITSNSWAVGVRSFNPRFRRKLLVLLDGRRVYTPTTGGVYWDVLDLPLEDVERIEVIRGPGGSAWGANAVDGVINIITKKAGETVGGLVTAGGGNLEQGFGTLQYGGNPGNGKHAYRMYAKYRNENDLLGPAGQDGGDGGHLLDGGFRADSAFSGKDSLMTQGNVYTGRENIPQYVFTSISPPVRQLVNPPSSVSGGYAQSVWNHVFSSRTDTTLEVSYDAYQRNDALREGRKTLTTNFQHHIALGERHSLRWGFSYVFSSSHSHGNLAYSLNPPDLAFSILSSFVQDEIALIPDRLYLTVGTKVERNHYTGWAAMPSARMAWQPSRRNALWAVFSSAVRTPDELDAAVRRNSSASTGPGGITVLYGTEGNPNYRNEGLAATEAGYRALISSRVSVDLAAYYNHYTRLQTSEPVPPFLESTPPPPHMANLTQYENLMHGEAHGLEIFSVWKVMSRWSLSPGYAFEGIHMHVEPASQNPAAAASVEGSTPHHSAQLRSRLDLWRGWEWDASAYFVDRLSGLNIPSHTRVDSQLMWKWSERGSFSLVGQNLQQDHHFEYHGSSGGSLATQVKRSGYAMIRWAF